MEGKSRKCSGSGGGNSCRGMSEELCGRAKPWRAGAPLKELVEHPWETYQPPKGVVEGPGSWGSCAFVATGETVRRVLLCRVPSRISPSCRALQRSCGRPNSRASGMGYAKRASSRQVEEAICSARGSAFGANDLQRLEALLKYL
jgi:hypothetical protein